MAIKEVRFDIYCKQCRYYNKSEAEDPCWDCLNEGQNYDSHKPIRFAEMDGKNGKDSHTKQAS